MNKRIYLTVLGLIILIIFGIAILLLFYRIPGDVNLDGQVTQEDAVWCQEAILGKRELAWRQRWNADVDQNGRLTARDCLLIQRMALGMEIRARPSGLIFICKTENRKESGGNEENELCRTDYRRI